MEKIGREFDGSDCFRGTIGAGKSSLTALIANRLGSEAFTNQLMIMRYYLYFMRNRKSTHFITNLFLNKRFDSIKQALTHENNVLDRSIYEDSLLFSFKCRFRSCQRNRGQSVR